jgi:TRAP-type mannitol/chloroaromatic compound transport system permease large subunit
MLAALAILAALLLRPLLDPHFGHPALFSRLAVFAAFALMIPIAIGTIAAAAAVWRAGVLKQVLHSTTQMTSMIFTILIGATVFSLVFRALRGDAMVQHALADLPGGVAGAVLIVMAAMFLLGFVMDAFEIIFVVVPIVAPALLTMSGVNPIWLGIMMAMNLQTSYMHPPLGPTLFYLRGAAPPEITTLHIYAGIIPFVLIQIAALLLLWFAPSLATWLPHTLYGG